MATRLHFVNGPTRRIEYLLDLGDDEPVIEVITSTRQVASGFDDIREAYIQGAVEWRDTKKTYGLGDFVANDRFRRIVEANDLQALLLKHRLSRR